MKFLFSLKSRIIATMSIMVFVCTISAMVLTGSLLARSYEDSVKRQLEATAAGLMSLGISNFSELEEFANFTEFIEGALKMEKVDKIVRVFDGSEKLIFTSLGAKYDRLPDVLPVHYKKPGFEEMKNEGITYQSLIVPYEVKKKKFYFLQVLIPLLKPSEIIELFWVQGAVVFLMLVALSIAMSMYLAARLTKPVKIVAEHLEALDPAGIDQWKNLEDVERGQYLGPITNGVNLLTERTKAAVSNLKKMTRFVSHELRNPLAIIQGEAETVLARPDVTREDYRRVIESSLEEVCRMSEIVTSVLRVGESERIISKFTMQKIRLPDWIEDNRKKWEKTLGRALTVEIQDGPMFDVSTDQRLLFRLIDNLVRNVSDHTDESSKCMIRVGVSNGRMRIEVEDTGGGMTDELISELNRKTPNLKPDYIGLSLCKRIADVCKFQLSFKNSREGGVVASIIF